MTKTKDKVLIIKCFNLSDAQADAVEELAKYMVEGKPLKLVCHRIESALAGVKIYPLETSTKRIVVFSDEELSKKKLIALETLDGEVFFGWKPKRT